MTLQIKQSTGPEFSRVLGLGGARGKNVVTNDDIAGPIDSSDEWIRSAPASSPPPRGAGRHVVDLAEAAAAQGARRGGPHGARVDA